MPMSMPLSSSKSPVFHISAVAARASEASAALPEWNLADLYPAIDAPEVAADLARADAECVAFEETYKGELADIAASPQAGEKLGAAVKRFEAVGELLGRLGSATSSLVARSPGRRARERARDERSRSAGRLDLLPAREIP